MGKQVTETSYMLLCSSLCFVRFRRQLVKDFILERTELEIQRVGSSFCLNRGQGLQATIHSPWEQAEVVGGDHVNSLRDTWILMRWMGGGWPAERLFDKICNDCLSSLEWSRCGTLQDI